MQHDATRQSGRSVMRALRRFRAIATSYPAVWIGFAFVCAWPWSCTSASLVYENASTVGSAAWLGSNLTYLVMGLCGFALGLSRKRDNPTGAATSTAAVAGVCYVAASVLFVMLCKLPSETIDASYQAVAVIWPFFAGAGQALLFVEWVKAFGAVGPRKTIALVVPASILGAALLIALNFIPQEARELMPALVGAAAAACAYAMARALRTRAKADEPMKETAPTAAGKAARQRPPWKLLVTAAVAGCAFGMFQSLSFTGTFGTTAWYTFGVVGFLVAAILLALITLVLRLNFNYMIYRFSFVLMALGGFVCVIAPIGSAWGYGIFCVGYRCFDMLVWCLCAHLIYRRHASSEWLGGLCVGSLLIGRFLGFEAFTLLHAAPFDISDTLLIVTVMFALMFTALSLVNHNNLLEAWGMAKPGEADDDAELLTLCCAHITDACGLSARERDVFEQLARGSSRADVGRMLVLSEETVKTHIRHIYRKCNIHSRQELEGLVAATRDELENDRMDLAKHDTFE